MISLADTILLRQILEKTGALYLRDLMRLLASLPAVRSLETADRVTGAVG